MNQVLFDNSDRYCIFRSGNGWYGLPALAVRGIVPRPTLTPTPCNDPILQGICHVQNEFMSVVSLQAITEIQYAFSDSHEQQMLIITGPHGSWGLLIDQAVTLAALEITISGLSNHQDKWSRVTTGSASFQNQVLQILDPSELLSYAGGLLDSFWQNSCPSVSQLVSK